MLSRLSGNTMRCAACCSRGGAPKTHEHAGSPAPPRTGPYVPAREQHLQLCLNRQDDVLPEAGADAGVRGAGAHAVAEGDAALPHQPAAAAAGRAEGGVVSVRSVEAASECLPCCPARQIRT